MGGPKRDPKDYIFKKPVVKPPKPKEPEFKPESHKPWIDLDELAFGKDEPIKNPKIDDK